MDIIKLAKVNKLIKTASSGGSRQATGFVSPAAQKQARLTTKIPVDSGLHGAALETTNIKYDQVAIDSIFKQLTANKVSNVSITDKGNGQSTITFVYNDHSTFSADVPTPAGQLVQDFYKLSTSNTEPPDADGWATVLGADLTPTADKPYLWNAEVTYMSYEKVPTKPEVDDNKKVKNAAVIANYSSNGANGASIIGVVNYYIASENQADPGDVWGTAEGTPSDYSADKPYLYGRERVYYDKQVSGSVLDNGEGTYKGKYYTFTEWHLNSKWGDKGDKGDPGKSGTAVKEFYALGGKDGAIPSSGWQDSLTGLKISEDSPYLWNYEAIYIAGQTEPSTPTEAPKTNVAIIANWSKDGANGANGASVTGVAEQYYATTTESANLGNKDGYSTPSEAGYSAIKCYLWNRERVYLDGTPQSWTPWVLISKWGDKGDKGDTGAKGDKGDKGENAKTVQEYYTILSESANSDALKAVADEDWKTSINRLGTMTSGQAIWNCEVPYTMGNTPSITQDAKGKATIIARYSKDGVGISSITEKYLATTASAGVTDKTSGWQESIPTIDSSKPYLWNYTTTVYTDGSSTSTKPVIIGHYGDGVPSLTAVSSLGSTAYLFLSGKLIYKTSETGHTRILFNPSTQQIDSVSNFADATTAGLMNTAGALTGINPNEIVILLSCGGCSLSSDERSSLNNNLGGYLTDTWGTDASAKAHAFIGMAGLTSGNAYESVFSDADTSTTSYEDFNTSDSGVLYDSKGDVFQVVADRDTRITCYFSDTGIVLNGAQGDTSVPKVDDNGDLSFVSKLTGKVVSFASGGNTVEKIGLVPKIDGNNDWVLGNSGVKLGAARYIPHFSKDGELTWSQDGTADSYNLKPTVTLERNSANTGANLTIKIGDSTAVTTLNDGKKGTADLTLPAPVDNGEYFLDFVYDETATGEATKYAMGIFSSGFTGDDATAESFHTDNHGNRLKGYAFGSSAYIQVCGSASEAQMALETGYPASIWITGTQIQLFHSEDGFSFIQNGELVPFTDADGGEVTIVWP